MSGTQAARNVELAAQALNSKTYSSSRQQRSRNTGLTAAKYLELLHPPGSRGFAFLSRNYPSKQVFGEWHWRDQSVKPTNIVSEGVEFGRGADRFVSMNRFKIYRQESHLVEMSAFYIDVDFYNVPRRAKYTPEQALHGCLLQLEEQFLPAPSLVLASGHGLLLVWLHNPIPAQALPRWQAVQTALCKSIKGFGVDGSGLSVTKVFRIVGSKNRRNTVRTIFPHSVDDVVRWDFDTLATEVLPLTRPQIAKKRAARKKRAGPPLVTKPKSSKPPVFTNYWKSVADELHRIRAHRFGDGLIPPGERDIFLFLLSVSAAWLLPADELTDHIGTLFAEYAAWNARDVRNRMCSVIKRAHKSARGEKITYRGRKVDARYRMMGCTMALWLGVTAEEASSLRLVLVMPAEQKKERRREAVRQCRKRKGAVNRASRKAERKKIAGEINKLTDGGKSLRAAAIDLKIAPGTAHAIQKEFAKKP